MNDNPYQEPAPRGTALTSLDAGDLNECPVPTVTEIAVGDSGPIQRWFVYLAVNPRGNTYVGITRGWTPDRRIDEHNDQRPGRKGAKATLGRGPWSLGYAETGFGTRSEAQSREYYLKRDRALRRRIARDMGLGA